MCSPRHVHVPLDKVARFLPPCRWLTPKPPRAELIMPVVCVSVRADGRRRGQASGPSSSVSPSTSVSARRTTERERRQRRHARHFLHLSSRENTPFLEAWREATEIRAQKWDMHRAFEKRDFSGGTTQPLRWHSSTPGREWRADGRARALAAVVHMCSWRRPLRPPARARRSAPCLCLPPSFPLQPSSVPDRLFRNEAEQLRATRRPVTHRNPVTMDMAAVLLPADSPAD